MPITSEITVKPTQFTAAVTWAAKWVASKPAVPAWGGLTLTIESGWLAVGAFSENASVRAVVEISGPAPAAAARQSAIVSGRLLAELAGTFDGKKAVTLAGGDGTLTLAAGRFVATLPCMDEDEFPALPGALPAIGTVGGAEFATAVKQVGVAVSGETKHLPLRAMHLTLGADGVLALAGSDSLRVVFKEVGWKAAFERDLARTPLTLTPYGETITTAAEAFDGPDEITIGSDGSSLSLTSPTRSLTMRTMDPRDPATGESMWPIAQLRKVTRTTPRPSSVTFSRGELAAPLKRARIVRGKDGPVRITIADDTLTVGAAEGETHRESGEEIDVDYQGAEYVAGFNPDLFGDALRSAPADTVRLAFGDPRASVLLTCDGDASWRHVLMPIRLH